MNYLLKFYQNYLQVLFFIAPKIAAKVAFKLFSTPINHKVRKPETDILQLANTFNLEIDHHNIVVYQWGNGSKKALMVHGWEGNGGSLGGIVKVLLDKDYTVFSFDGPAHGKSTGKLTNAIIFSTTVIELIKRFDIKDCIACHSFGSATTVYGLAQHNALAIENLLLLTSPNELKNVLKEFAMVLKVSEAQMQYVYAEIYKRYHIHVEAFKIADYLHQTQVKNIHLIHDENDRIIPLQYSRDILAENPQAHLHIVNHTGHYRMLWHEKVLNIVKSIV